MNKMAKTGIKKYDELPSRVGFIDVDAKRAALSKYMAIAGARRTDRRCAAA